MVKSKRKRSRRRLYGEVDIDITAVMNLMVILAPFLLLTAVFSRITILDLYLPNPSPSATQPADTFQLEVVVRKDRIELRERATGTALKLDRQVGGFDLKPLTAALEKVKERFPAKLESTLLAESSTDYDTLVKVMDAMRVKEGSTQGVWVDLFPSISIGDAPPERGALGAGR